MSIWRPEFLKALQVFAAVSTQMEAEGFSAPVLVGGAAIEFYSGSSIATGDFDIVTGRQDRFEQILQQHGFVRLSGRNLARRGWIHPTLGLGFEVVGAALLDGQAETDRILLIQVTQDTHFSVIAVEDLIADRMSQYHSGTAPEMLAQAKTIFSLYKDEEFEKRPRTNMELRTFNLSRSGMSLADFGQDLACRIKAAGPMTMPRNSGLRRTESKRALLAAIEETGARW